MKFDDSAQIYTIEGFAAALILIGVLIIIFNSISIVTPQTETSTDMKAFQLASDVSICIDRPNEDHSSELKAIVLGWNGGTANYSKSVNDTENGMKSLDSEIATMMPTDMRYNVELYFYDGSSNRTVPVIVHGVPGDNSVVASRLVTLNTFDNASAYWNSKGRFPQVVQARLIAWYL